MITPKENLLRVIRHDNPAWVPSGLESVTFLYPPYMERPSDAGDDAFGVRWDLRSHALGGTYPAHRGNPISDLSLWREQVAMPDTDGMDWGLLFLDSDYRIPIRIGDIDRSEHLVCGMVPFGLFERSYLLMGMEQALMAYVAEPALMDGLLSSIADFKIDVIKRFHEVARVDMVFYGDDWGTQRDLFMSPQTWRRIVKPHTQRIYDCMKESGIIIYQHSCGKIESILEDVVEMGADIWEPCQPCNNLVELKRKHGGRITFCGGIDSQFVLGRPGVTLEEVRSEVRKRIDELALGGGYIAAPSQDLPYDREILAAMNDEIAKYGSKYYENRTGT